MRESILIRFLYKTSPGRSILKLLVNPSVSRCAAKLLSSRASVRFIPGFIKKNNIDIDEYEVPEEGFESFNDFFTRRIKSDKRVIDDGTLISPCDGYLTVSKIDEHKSFQIKNTTYTVNHLLGDESLANEFIGGTAFIFRLTPADYHRYIFCSDGTVKYSKHIDGILHSVKPVCLEEYPVFIQNSREYTVINNRKIGNMIQMEVGALLVGKISNKVISFGERISAGREKGCFEYGGSTIIVLTKAKPQDGFISRYKFEAFGEVPVKMGEVLIEN